MAYVIKKSPHIVDEVTIDDEDSTIILKVDIYVDDILADFNANRKKLVEAKTAVEQLKASGDDVPPETMEQACASFAEASDALFTMVFGAYQTKLLLESYGDRRLAMLRDFMPYFTGVILPEVQAAQKDLADSYKSWGA